ncbi:MAG: HAMP domain-containing protein [Chloroflexi bacterium]|nr:HAMP domain-containing protein [Chloroflexota bacterium]
MNRLWVRLTLAFALVAVIGIGLASLLANLAISNEFRSFVGRSEATSQSSDLATKLVDYYATHQSWDGLRTILIRDKPSDGPAPDPGAPPPDRFGPPVSLIIADANGLIVFDSDQHRADEVLSQAERDAATALTDQDQTIGYLLFTPGPVMTLRPTEQFFVDQVRQNLVLAALIASAIGAVLGLLFSRTLTRPLNRLAVAARAIAAKDLTQRVEPSGTVEVANVAVAFNDMASSLQKAEELRRNLVADVAHELRTPLSVMQGTLTAQLDGVFPLDLSETAKLYDETRLLSRLVDDLRELAQVEAGQLQLNIGAIDLKGVIATTVSAFEGAATEKQVQLTAAAVEQLPLVKADSERVAQVLRVLISNALRHTPANGTITVAAMPVADQVEVSVHDTGEGIAPDELPYVFDRFWRGDKSRARESGGSGLGLAIAKQLIEAQGGSIGVESQANSGSRFWFRLLIVK